MAVDGCSGFQIRTGLGARILVGQARGSREEGLMVVLQWLHRFGRRGILVNGYALDGCVGRLVVLAIRAVEDTRHGAVARRRRGLGRGRLLRCALRGIRLSADSLDRPVGLGSSDTI